MWGSLQEMRATTLVMLGVSLRARWDATLVIIMDAITENIEMDPPWAMMFVYDLVMCDIIWTSDCYVLLVCILYC